MKKANRSRIHLFPGLARQALPWVAFMMMMFLVLAFSSSTSAMAT